MKEFRITINVKYNQMLNRYYALSNNKFQFSFCEELYNLIVGKEVVGKVTFIFTKIKNPREYKFPFRVVTEKSDWDSVEVRVKKKWEYVKYLFSLEDIMDVQSFQEWAGKSYLALRMEYLK